MEVSNQGWSVHQFTPSGVIRLAWPVKSLKGNIQDLKLELQPAQITSSGDQVHSDSAGNAQQFVTTIEPILSPWQKLSKWYTDNWQAILSVAVGLGAAIVAVVKWGGSLGEALRSSISQIRGGNSRSNSTPQDP